MSVATVKLGKWGNSVGVRLPNRLVEEVGVGPGDIVEITVRPLNTTDAIWGMWKDLVSPAKAMEMLDELEDEEDET